MMSLLLLMLQLAGEPPASPCPSLAGVWTLAENKRVMVLDQEGCRLVGTVQEPLNQTLHVRGFWTGSYWTMSATRVAASGCGTTAWGSIAAADANRMLIRVRGSDGLCAPDGSAGTGPAEFDATMTYRRMLPPPPVARRQ